MRQARRRVSRAGARARRLYMQLSDALIAHT